MLTQNQLIYTKIEAVQGTDPTPTTGDFLAVHDLSITPNISYISPQAQDESLSPRPGVLGLKTMDISFTHEIQVNDSAQTVPPCDALLQACGFDDKEGDSAVDGKYYPASIPALKCTKVPFDQGSGTVAVGDTVVGEDSGASGICHSIALTSGTWGVDAAGWLYISDIIRTPGAADQTTGSGLSDLTMGGTYTGNANTTFLINCDLADTTDTFKWRQDGGSWTEGVAMTGAAQTLADGVTVTFGATTGHTLNDEWTITCNDTYEDNENLTVSGTECIVDGEQIVPACTIWAFYEDTVFKLNGCKGNAVFNLVAGQIASITFNLTGEYIKSEDTTFPTSVTDDGGAPLVTMNNTFTWGDSYPCVESMSFSLNNTISVPTCLSKTHAAADVQITGRAPEVSWNPMMTVATDIDHWTPFEAVTQSSISYELTNSTVDFTINIPKIAIKNIQEGENNGILTYEITGHPIRTTADDELFIQFSAT